MRVLSQKNMAYEVLLNQLILVNSQDGFESSIDKWKAHSNTYLQSPEALPHRAFSIFLFNSKNELLLQKRSIDKKTFPLCWTNTCCSHPNMIKQESGEVEEQPIRESLHRALHRELRLNLRHSPFFFMNKILYKQLGFQGSNFGEFEVDYVYLNKLTTETIEFEKVPQEVAQTRWISKSNLKDFMDIVIQDGGYFSPWFSQMTKSGLLYKWWEMVEENKIIEQIETNSPVIDLQQL